MKNTSCIELPINMACDLIENELKLVYNHNVKTNKIQSGPLIF